MSRLIWITAVITALVAVIVSWEAKRCYAKAEECKSSPQTELFLAPSRTTITPHINQKKTPDETSRACANANSYLCVVLAPANLPTLYLVIIGIGGIVIGIGTLQGIREQTNHLVSSERAWVVAELIPMAAKRGGKWYRIKSDELALMTTAEVLKGDYLKHRLKLTNMGKTPAHIFRYSIEYSSEAQVKGGELIPIPASEPIDKALDRLIGGADAVDFEEIDLGKHIADHAKTGILSGSVKYQHMFSEELATANFVYLYDGDARQLTRIPTQKTKKKKKKAN